MLPLKVLDTQSGRICLLAQLGKDNFYEEILRSQQEDPHLTELVSKLIGIKEKTR